MKSLDFFRAKKIFIRKKLGLAKNLVLDSMSNMMSLMCKEYNKGPSTVPCRIPDARRSSLI